MTRRRTAHRPSVHRELVRRWGERGFTLSRFHVSLAAAIADRDCSRRACTCESENCYWREVYAALRAAFPRIPDGFQIDANEEHVTLLEVEVASPLTSAKIEHIADLVGELDFYGAWSLDVLRVDRFGRELRVPWHALGDLHG